MTHWGSHARLWTVTVIGLLVDLWSKEWAFHTLKHGETRSLVDNLLSLKLSLNPGALFGLGAGFAPVFVGASVLALMFVLYLFAHSTASRRSMHIALGLVLSGALGNLYDRTTQTAQVLHFTSGGRSIGTLVDESDTFVTLGDYKSGARPQTFMKSGIAASKVEPVVRDFIQIETKIGGYNLWPWIFNIADALLVVGVGLLLINFWTDRDDVARPANPVAPQGA
ncbi:MAG: signal peptidase II [Planctomycetes bacterium]|nr:signal peptidase II [Planctomycetota bacterium]